MDIGRPRRIIEIEPVAAPVPEPMPMPERVPESVPVPVRKEPVE
ncbi:MAG TPA: hypothetical protein VJN50_04710 [Actinomycetota bacterium]|nr:hypothetical protein [Actinomycetota bacterium]